MHVNCLMLTQSVQEASQRCVESFKVHCLTKTARCLSNSVTLSIRPSAIALHTHSYTNIRELFHCLFLEDLFINKNPNGSHELRC